MLSLQQFLEDTRLGKCSDLQAQTEALEQTNRYNPDLRAIREWLESPIAVNNGPLSGVTVSAKDNIGVEGMQTWAGSAKALPAQWAQSGSFIRRLQSLGAVITSKSLCAEFALGGSGYNPNQGTPINPYSGDTPRVPGGSSSGTAVAVASGMAMLGVGTDTGGSIRVPAALCGCVGYRASLQHWPMDGIVPLLPRADTLGLITRDVQDMVRAVSSIDNLGDIEALPLQGLRVALWPESLMHDCDPERRDAMLQMADTLKQAGCELLSAEPRAIERGYACLANGPNTAVIEFARFLNAELPDWRPTLNPQVAQMLEENEDIRDDELEARNQEFMQLTEHLESFFAGADFVLSPTTASAPPAIEALNTPEGYEQFSNGLLGFTVIGSVYRCCGISVPAGLDRRGLPMGLQFLARPNDDRRLLAAALALQSLLPVTTQLNA